MYPHRTLEFEQVNANTCRAVNYAAKHLADKALSYTSKAKVYNEDLGRDIIIDVTRSLARKQSGQVTFPFGLIKFIMRKANERGHECNVSYLDPYTLPKKLIPQLPGIKLETFQAKMLRKVGIYKRGVLIGPTAMGKSVVLGGIVDKLNMPVTICIVPNQTIFRQIYQSFCAWFGEDIVGRIGQGIYDQRQITVCMYQSISKYQLAYSNLKLVLIDEAHLINDTIIRFLRKCKNVYYRYGVTATPHLAEDNFVKAMQMEGFIGPVICEVNDKEAENRVLPVKVKLISFYCSRPKGKTYQKVLRQDILLSDLRNAKLLKAAHDEALTKGMTCLFLIDEVEQGKRIVDLAGQMNIPITFAHGKLSKGEIKRIIKQLNNREIQFVVATKVFGVGTDIPNVDAVVLGSTRKSEIDTLQKIGRGRRRVDGSDYLVVIDSIDKVRGNKFNRYFYDYSLTRLNIYKAKGWEINKLMF